MQYLLVGLEGLLTFLSPCILPMLPIYVAYFTGDYTEGQKQHPVINALAFVLGFGIVFVTFGLLLTTLSRFLIEYRRPIQWVSGGVLIILGVDVWRGNPWMSRLQPVSSGQTTNVTSPWGAFVLGLTFAVSWTPCVGTFLAGVLAMVIQSQSYFVAGSLLITYVLGLGIPFILVSILIDELQQTLTFLKKHMRLIQMISGIILIIMGMLTMTGQMEQWLIWLS